ncbi:MAG: Uma2 family endonuclease [Cyanobacteria bacterium J06639_1]
MTAATPVSVPLGAIQLAPGSAIAIEDISWEQYERILAERGMGSLPRIAYFEGTVELVAPLPAHERPNRFLSDLVKALLDSQERDWEDFGSTTLRRAIKQAGLEPDSCFYLDANAEQVRSCWMEMDLGIYPPPDLAIESDLTSRTALDAYKAIAVPELWIYRDRQLSLYRLRDNGYTLSETSAVFPDMAIVKNLSHWVERGMTEGASRVLREFRQVLERE